MISKFLTVATAVVALSQNVYANSISGDVNLINSKLETITVKGNQSFKNSQFKSLTAYGTLNFDNIIIDETLKVDGAANGKILACKAFHVNGALNVQNLKSSEAIVKGAFNGEDVVITGKTIIEGELNAKNSSFQDIEIKSTKSSLDDSTAHNILVNPTKNKPQKIILKGNTVISGDIVFEAGDGEVHVGDKVKIKGHVKGAKVIHDGCA